MVFHLFERIFGISGGDLKARMVEDSHVKYYVRKITFTLTLKITQGFSEEEAKDLAWLMNLKDNGKIYGKQ
jgi:hypothetical protein